jgi:hypothetical protein
MWIVLCINGRGRLGDGVHAAALLDVLLLLLLLTCCVSST